MGPLSGFAGREYFCCFWTVIRYTKPYLSSLLEKEAELCCEEINNSEEINISNVKSQINMKAELIIRGSTAP
jgi:hypothetical protein